MSVRRALALLGLAACLASCGRHRPALVVWIEVDTLRADALGCYGSTARGENGCAPSPNVDRLAAEGVRFERAYSAAPWTIPSLVTQLSGRWPWEHQRMRLLETLRPEETPLVPLLRQRGWRTAGVTTNFVATSRYGFAHGFERFDDSLAQGHEGATSHEAVAKLLELLDELRAEPGGDGASVFLFGLLFEPHFRYEAHDGFRFGPGFGSQAAAPYAGPLTGEEPLNDLLRRRAELTEADAAFLRGRYQSEVAWADDAVGDLVDGLARRGLLKDALIVLTADHGEEILHRGWIGHSVDLYDDLVRVPLIVRLPERLREDRAGVAISDPVSLIDLPMTLADLMVDLKWREHPDPAHELLGHSRSLVPTILEGETPERRWLWLHTDFQPVLAELGDEKSALMWGVFDAHTWLKWIVDHKVPPGEAARAHLFDLASDPEEAIDLAGQASAEAARALTRLEVLSGGGKLDDEP